LTSFVWSEIWIWFHPQFRLWFLIESLFMQFQEQYDTTSIREHKWVFQWFILCNTNNLPWDTYYHAWNPGWACSCSSWYCLPLYHIPKSSSEWGHTGTPDILLVPSHVRLAWIFDEGTTSISPIRWAPNQLGCSTPALKVRQPVYDLMYTLRIWVLSTSWNPDMIFGFMTFLLPIYVIMSIIAVVGDMYGVGQILKTLAAFSELVASRPLRLERKLATFETHGASVSSASLIISRNSLAYSGSANLARLAVYALWYPLYTRTLSS